VIVSGVEDRRGDNYLLLLSNGNTLNDYDYTDNSYGVYLVSDGGTTLSSQQDPSINANNANAPAANVSAPVLLGLMSLGLFGFASRRSSTTLDK
jgi:parallel beta-helix repeat protein